MSGCRAGRWRRTCRGCGGASGWVRTTGCSSSPPLAFDASIDQIFPALSCGAALVLPEHGLVAPATLLPLLDEHDVTLANLPPAYFGELVAELTERDGTVPRALRSMVLGGDVVRPADVDRFATCCPT